MAEEFAGREQAAVKWYTNIVEQFPDSPQAAKARGATRRIESTGQPLVLKGSDSQGNTIDVQSYRGKVVLLHYWATNNPYCMPGIAVLRDVHTRYGKDKIALIGVNVDSDRRTV